MARRILASVALLTLAALAVPAAAAQAVSIDNGGRGDRSVTQLQRGAATACRTPLRSVSDDAPEQCAPIDGRAISEARINAYEGSWTHRALSLQRGLDDAAPLIEEQMPHTHNSFNASSFTVGSTSYYPTLTNQDPNQVYSITDQLRMDVRAIEIDLHWWPSPYAAAHGRTDTGGKWVTMCHGDSGQAQGYVHVGCTWDRPFEDGLAEVKAWLTAHPDQVILLYLENQLLDQNGYNAQAQGIAADLISKGLGDLVYRPKAGACDDMPFGVSRAQMRAEHRQVLIVGNCGTGGAWGTWVHERGPHWDESGNPTTYGDKDCTRDSGLRSADSTFRRWYEDSTWLTAMVDGSNSHITPETTARMVKCGVNIVGFDQLTPDDGRLTAFVWSWAEAEPKAGAGNCAYQGGDGRFHAGNCNDRHHVACVDATGAWHVTAATTKWTKSGNLCAREFPGTKFGVPPNGFRNQQIVNAKGSPSDQVWLNYASVKGTWTPSH